MNSALTIGALVAAAVATVAVGAYGLRRSRTTSDFLVASRTVAPHLNAAAISGEYLSAASFLGVAALIAKYGTDDITSQEWARRVLKHGLHEINNNIDRAKSLYQRGGVKIFAVATVEVINKGLPKSSRMSLDEASGEEDRQSSKTEVMPCGGGRAACDSL